jgi:serine/threonine protein phosphatase 1
MPGRTIAIGDIHGCSLALDALLDAIEPRPEDIIVTLGDYINRGPDTKGVLDRLIDLGRRYRLVPVLGNHDQKLLEARTGLHPTTWLGMGGIATLDSYGPGRDIALIPDEHFEFLEGCLDFHETDTHIFVHANYFPDIPMAEQPVGMLRWESLRDMTPGPHNSGKTVIVGHTSQKDG